MNGPLGSNLMSLLVAVTILGGWPTIGAMARQLTIWLVLSVFLKQLVAEWSPLYADSNEAGQLRDMARTLTNGICGPARCGFLKCFHAIVCFFQLRADCLLTNRLLPEE
jgi:hypothetical protein